MKKTIIAFLNGQGTREIGTVLHEKLKYTVRLRFNAATGSAVGEIREDGEKKWSRFTGKFQDDQTLQHFIDHSAEFSLADGAKLYLTDAVVQFLDVLDDCVKCGSKP